MDFVLNGEGYEIGKYGFTPPSFSSYDVTKIKGYTFNIDSARYYFKKAGFENGKGFEVFSVSLDGMPQQQQAKEDWLKAIEQDGLIWKSHVSDLKFWNNAAAKAWGVTSIPATYLLDKEGKVIAKNLRGQALEAKLKEILQ